jgi:hypothetical protein
MSNADNVTMTAVGGNAYSFYLNIVVLDHHPATNNTSSLSEDEGPFALLEEDEPPTKEQNDERSLTSPTSTPDRKSRIFHDLDKSIHSFGKAVSKKSSAVGNKAAAFVASKTMVSRVLSSLAKSLPELPTEELELTIGQRFHQGRVIVLHVVLKPASMCRYLEEVNGLEAADQYRSAMSTLKLLGATNTMSSLEKEQLPLVRQKLMERLTELLLKTMKEKDALLEVECIHCIGRGRRGEVALYVHGISRANEVVLLDGEYYDVNSEEHARPAIKLILITK